jgi:NAD(P)-dependent dehydrogenase (short-subunit alcohol dehydrogenase family)
MPTLIRTLSAAFLSLFVLLSTALATPDGFSADARTVLITGANRGIGLEFVRQYTDAGWNVIATCRSPAKATLLNELAAGNGNVIVEQLDLLDHAGIDALAVSYKDQPIDVLLNNAGLMRGPSLEQMVGSIDYDEFILTYRINAMGPLKVSEAFYKNVKQSELKTMAALTTGKGDKGIPVPGFSLYKTSKAALDAIQTEIALRWQRQGIKVVTLLPGRVLTHGEAADGPNTNAIPVEESIAGMIKVIDEFDMAQTGHTIQWDGEFIE